MISPLRTQAKATAKLLQAVEKGDLATAEDCLAKGANIEYKNEKVNHVTFTYQ